MTCEVKKAQELYSFVVLQHFILLFSKQHLGFALELSSCIIKRELLDLLYICDVKKKKKKIEEQAEKHLAVNQSDSNIYFCHSLITEELTEKLCL